MAKDAGVWASDQGVKAETIQEVLAKMKERWEGTEHGNGAVKKVRCTYIRI